MLYIFCKTITKGNFYSYFWPNCLINLNVLSTSKDRCIWIMRTKSTVNHATIFYGLYCIPFPVLIIYCQYENNMIEISSHWCSYYIEINKRAWLKTGKNVKSYHTKRIFSIKKSQLNESAWTHQSWSLSLLNIVHLNNLVDLDLVRMTFELYVHSSFVMSCNLLCVYSRDQSPFTYVFLLNERFNSYITFFLERN